MQMEFCSNIFIAHQNVIFITIRQLKMENMAAGVNKIYNFARNDAN